MKMKRIAVAAAWVGLLLCGNGRAVLYSAAGDTVVPLWVQELGGARQAVALADLGLQGGDDVDAVSLGGDPLPGETDPMGQRLDVFAVAPNTGGQPGSALAARAAAPGSAVERDIYRESSSLNEVLFPELIAAGAIDAFDGGILGPGGGQWVYFSLTPGSPTLGANGWSAGDVLMVQYKAPGTLAVFAAASEIGDPADIDALSVKDAAQTGAAYAFNDDMVIYSADAVSGIIYHYGDGAPKDNQGHDHHSFGLKMFEDVEALAHVFFRGLEQRFPLIGMGEEYGVACYALAHDSPPDTPVQRAYYYCASRELSPDPTSQAGKFGVQGDANVPAQGFDRFRAALAAAGKVVGDVKLRWTPGDLNNDARGDLATWGQGAVADWWYDPATKIELRQYDGAVSSVWVEDVKIAGYPETSMWMHIDFAAAFAGTGDVTLYGWAEPGVPIVEAGLQAPYDALAAAFLADHGGKVSRMYLDSVENPTQQEFNSVAGVGSYFAISSGFIQVLDGASQGVAQVWIDHEAGVVLNGGADVWPGQSVTIELPLRNDGAGDALATGVSILPQLPLGNGGGVADGTAHYGNVLAGATGVAAQAGDSLMLQLGSDFPVNTDLPIRVVIEYGDGAFATDEFTISVRGQSVSGAVTYTGQQQGPWVVQAWIGAQLVASTEAAALGRSLAYEFNGLAPGTYDISAFVDVDGDGAQTYPEALGYHPQQVVVTDTSAVDIDIVIADHHSDADGLPDWWELLHGYNEGLDDSDENGTNDQDEDSDGDGENNLTEYNNGTDPNDAASAQNPFHRYQLELHRGADQTVAGRGFTTVMWGASLSCWPPDGMLFQSGTLTKPDTSTGASPAELGLWGGGQQVKWMKDDYGSFAALVADMVGGDYEVDLVMVPASPRGEARSAQHLRFSIALPLYAEKDFPEYVTVLAPVPGATDIATEPLFEFDISDWATLSVRKPGMSDGGYFAGQQGVPSTTHQLPPGNALLPGTLYDLAVHRTDWETYLGSQTFVAFTTAGSSPAPPLFRLELTGGSVEALEFGALAEATAAPDSGIDRLMPPPLPQVTGEAVFLAPEGPPDLERLQRDIRASVAGSRWQVEATAAVAADLGISWNPGALPNDPALLIWRLTERDGAVVPGSIALMADVTAVTVPAGETYYYAIGALIAFEVQTDPVAVPEGSTADAFVRLTAMPSGTLSADLSWTDGDTDLGLAPLRGASLTFTDTNWDTWQSVSLAAAEDDSEGDDGSATFTLTKTAGPDPVDDLTFTATEQDDDVSVTLALDGMGTTIPSGSVWVDINAGDDLAIEAVPGLDWSFVNWTLDPVSAAVLGSSTARVTIVIPTADVTVTAHLAGALTVSVQTPDTPATVLEGSVQDFVVTAAGGAKPYTYVWRMDEVTIENEDTDTYTYAPSYAVVGHSEESIGKTLVCTVTDSADRRVAADATWNITVQDVDRAAPAPIVEITSGAPVTEDDLVAVVTQQEADPDGDEIIGYHYEWTLFGQSQAGGAGTLGYAHTQKGDVWQVSVSAKTKPYGEGGPEVISLNAGMAEVTIGNTVPVAVPVAGLAVQAGAEIFIQFVGLDPDVDQGVDELTFAIATSPANGSVRALDPVAGTVIYEPGVEFTGPVSFDFSVDDDGEAPVQEASVSVFVYSEWLVTMTAAGGVPELLQFGVTDGATAAFDSTLDLPSDGGDTVGFLVDGVRQRRAMLGLVDEHVWEFEVVTAGGPVTLAWDPGAISDPGLALVELDGPVGAYIPGTTLDMRDNTELIVGAGRNLSTRVFRIQEMTSIDLNLEKGWNLVSLPLTPIDPAVEVVFGTGNVVSEQPVRDASYVDGVYSWDHVLEQYESVAEVEPLVGYWVNLSTAADFVVRGLPVADGPIPLLTAWNLVGVARPVDLVENPDVYFPAWVWNAVDQAYAALRVGDVADPGIAFWVYATRETDLVGE